MGIAKRIKQLLSIQLSLAQIYRPRAGTVRTRLTPSGWGFFGLILTGFLLSVNFSNNLIFSMTFLLTSIAMVGWYYTRINVSGLVFRDWRVQPVFAGQKARYSLQLDNLASRDRHGIAPLASKAVMGNEIHIGKNSQAELVVYRKTKDRGLLGAVRGEFRSCFPLGILQTRMVTGSLPECLVYPAPLGEQPLPDKASGKQAHLQSESGTYTDMRRYAPGDPLSRISWKALARTGELYTKQFDGAQGQPALWLRFDDVLAAGVEQKLSQLCRWILEVRKQNREFGLELPGVVIEPDDTESHMRRCLTALSLYGKKGQP